MASEQRTHAQRWADYLVPGTEVLKNLAGIEDAEEWKLEEGFRAALGRINIPEFGFTNASSISEELKLIHETVFGECYEWAGQFRTVTMSKASEDNPDVISYFTPHEDIDDDLEYLNEYVQRVDWDSATFEDKRDELAKIHAELNRIHPFREGNGRSCRIFMEIFASRHDVDLRWDGHEDQLRRAGSLSLTTYEDRIDVRPWQEMYRGVASVAQFSDPNQPDLFALLGWADEDGRSTPEVSLSMHDVHSHGDVQEPESFPTTLAWEDEDVTELE